MAEDNLKNNVDPKLWYSAAEAAQHLGVKEQTVTEYCREGRLKKTKKQGPKKRWHIQGVEIIRLRKEWGLDG